MGRGLTLGRSEESLGEDAVRAATRRVADVAVNAVPFETDAGLVLVDHAYGTWALVGEGAGGGA